MQNSGVGDILGENDPRSSNCAMLGGVQTAPRSEAYAVARILTMRITKVTNITDKVAKVARVTGM